MILLNVPNLGYIVGCYFPHENAPPYSPGEKYRPCLVLQVIKRIDKPEIQLVVCYGTAQSDDVNKHSIKSRYVEISPGALNGNSLKETTRFNLKRIFLIPFTSEYFTYKGTTNQDYCLYGKISTEKEDELIKKLQIGNFMQIYSAIPNTTIISNK